MYNDNIQLQNLLYLLRQAGRLGLLNNQQFFDLSQLNQSNLWNLQLQETLRKVETIKNGLNYPNQESFDIQNRTQSDNLAEKSSNENILSTSPTPIVILF